MSKDLSEITRREKMIAMRISNNDISWNANFAMLVEYVGENFKLPSKKDGPTSDNGKTKLGKWYLIERNKSHTTARGDCMEDMQAIVSILYNRNHLRKLGSDEKIGVKKMISHASGLPV